MKSLMDIFKKTVKAKQISTEERKEYALLIEEGCGLSKKSLEIFKNPERADCLINKLRDPTEDNLSSVLITLNLVDSEEDRAYFRNISEGMKKKYG